MRSRCSGLEKFLADYPGAVMAVTHDRYSSTTSPWICEADRGQLYPTRKLLNLPENKAARLEAQNQQDAKRAKKMRAELEWVRSFLRPPGKEPRASWIAMSRWKQRLVRPRSLDSHRNQIPVGPRARRSWRLDHIHKAFGDRVLSTTSFSLPRNGIVGVIGPNGVGKLHAVQGYCWPGGALPGTLEIGETVQIFTLTSLGRESIQTKLSGG